MMIKPDAVGKNHIGPIIQIITNAGFRIRAMKFLQLTTATDRTVLCRSHGKAFYTGLIEFIEFRAGCGSALLEKDNAIEDFREIIGTTDA